MAGILSRIMTRDTIAALALFLLATALAVVPGSAQMLYIEAGRVIPGDGSAPIEDAAMVVENGTIRALGRRGDFAWPAPARKIDLAGKTVMPAIIATHVHPGFQRGLSYSPDNFTRETIMEDLNRALCFGVSAVQSLGIEQGDVLLQMRAEQAAGKLGGAQLLVAGRGIGAPDAGPGNNIYAHFAYALSSEDEMRRAVREQAARKVDIIKIWVDDRGGRAPRITMPVARVAIEEAHKAGIKIAAHIFYHEDAVALAEAGMNLFAHLVRDKVMSDELIATMVRNKVYVNPNIGSPERAIHSSPPPWMDEPYLSGLLRETVQPAVIERIRNSFAGRKPEEIAARKKGYEILKQSTAKLAAAGAPMVLGADTGLEDHVFGYAEQKELGLMVEAGVTPSQAIVAATSRAAEFLGLSDRGLIAPGKRADLLVLDANPLDDIRNTRRISKLYIAGAEVDRAAIKASLARGAPN
jgi:imidazolonepropionase-like amidohydrolase